MSRARRIPDFERTQTMLDLVHRIYPELYPDSRAMSRSHVVIEECAPSTGFLHAQRYADVVALSVWPSKGMTLDGYEIKASRADLKKELADPAKHEAIARYCDTWRLVVWDDSVLVDGIPESWGIMTTVEGEHERELVTKRRAAKRTPEPWPRSFVCSLVRNAFEQSPTAGYVARACAAAKKQQERDSDSVARNERIELLGPLAAAVYGKESWRWPREARDLEHLVKVAAERLTQQPFALERPA